MGRAPASEPPRKVLAVNTSDVGGGAERIAWALFKGMQRAGWDSWLIVGDKKTDDDRVTPFYLSPHIDYKPYSSALHAWRVSMQKRWDRAWGIEDYRFPYSARLLEIAGSEPDVVHFHNLHGGYFDLRIIAKVSHRLPTFVMLEDCWLFTGHCVYPLGCERWRGGCGACPMLQLPPQAKRRDATRYN